MTIRELYDWAKENNALDLDIEIQYRDDGGNYNGVDECCDPIITDSYYKYLDDKFHKHTEKVVLL